MHLATDPPDLGSSRSKDACKCVCSHVCLGGQGGIPCVPYVHYCGRVNVADRRVVVSWVVPMSKCEVSLMLGTKIRSLFVCVRGFVRLAFLAVAIAC